jgi:hypothetical protein
MEQEKEAKESVFTMACGSKVFAYVWLTSAWEDQAGFASELVPE